MDEARRKYTEKDWLKEAMAFLGKMRSEQRVAWFRANFKAV